MRLKYYKRVRIRSAMRVLWRGPPHARSAHKHTSARSTSYLTPSPVCIATPAPAEGCMGEDVAWPRVRGRGGKSLCAHDLLERDGLEGDRRRCILCFGVTRFLG